MSDSLSSLDVSMVYEEGESYSEQEDEVSTSQSITESMSSASAFDERLESIQQMQKEKGIVAAEEAPIPFPIQEPKLYDEKIQNLKEMSKLKMKIQDSETDDQFDQNLSSPDEISNIDKLTLEQQSTYFKKLAAKQLRERTIQLSTEKKLNRGQKQKVKRQQQLETFKAEYEMCQQNIQNQLQAIAKSNNIKLEILLKMLESSEIDDFDVSQDVKDQIQEFQKELAKASPINDHFIEDIGRLKFNYKEVEKKDFGLTSGDMMTLDDKMYDQLVLELPEYEGLGDVDIALYRRLQSQQIITGTRQYTKEDENQQAAQLAAARLEVRSKYPWLFQKRKVGKKQNMSKREQIEQIKKEKTERRYLKNAKQEKRGK